MSDSFIWLALYVVLYAIGVFVIFSHPSVGQIAALMFVDFLFVFACMVIKGAIV